MPPTAADYKRPWHGKFFDAGAATINVLNKAYGVAADGVTVDDAAITAALSDAPATGATIVFPATRRDGTRAIYLIDAIDLGELGKAGLTVVAYGATFKKAATTATHMFRDTQGKVDGLRWFGGEFDMNRAAFAAGATVSPFSFIRCDDLLFRDIYVRDGIEEGLKLYKCRRVRILFCHFNNIRNNGVQLHVPSTDGYTGTKPDQGCEDVKIIGCRFTNIDDGLDGTGDGTAVAMNCTSTTQVMDGVFIAHNFIRDCVRGPWAEFNTADNPGRNIIMAHNRIELSEFHGMGLIGVHGGGAWGNVFRDIGKMTPSPPATSSEVFAIKLGGSANPKSRAVVVKDNTILESRTGASQYMQYGVVVDQAMDCVVRDNRVVGAKTQKLWVVSWPNVSNSTVVDVEPPSVNVKGTATYSQPNASWQTVTGWNVERWDPEDWWASAQPSRITPKTPGRVLVECRIVFPTNGTGKRGLRLYQYDASAAVNRAIDEHLVPAYASDDVTLYVSAEVEAEDGDYFYVMAYQDSGAAMTLDLSTDRCRFAARWISGK